MTLHESSRPPESSVPSPLPLPVYVINIDRAAERMAELAREAHKYGVGVERVAGIDGTRLSPAERVDTDEALFFRRNGRPMLAGEYGCYRSHMLAFEKLLGSDMAAAIIVEDDVSLDGTFLRRAQAIRDTVPAADVVKLVNHRAGGFHLIAESALGDRVGRCFLGPQGSAACYMVSRAGAAKLLKSLQVMTLPFDVALERGWASGVDIYTVDDNILEFGAMREATMIGTRADYRAVKLPQWRRLPAFLFRLREQLARIGYVAGTMLRKSAAGPLRSPP